MEQLPACPGFQGNADFYGLGIRLGVYLQLVSSWISNSLNPESAADNHDSNSIFVCAILIAIINSAIRDPLRPIEVWITLQICLAFFFTVLGVLGLRVHLLHPHAMSRLIRDARAVGWEPLHKAVLSVTLSYIRMRLSLLKYLGLGSKYFHSPSTHMSFRTLTFVKHRSLSWGGAIWRTIILAALTVINIWFWFQDIGTQDSTCNPTAFFFARLPLEGRLLSFFRTLSVIIAIPGFYLISGMTSGLFMLLQLLQIAIIRRATIRYFQTQKPGFWDEVPEKPRRFLAKLSPTIISAGSKGPFSLTSILGILHGEFGPQGTTAIPSLSDLAKSYAYVCSRTIEREPDEQQREETELTTSMKIICLLWHIFVVAGMAWFILSIELTIAWNNISGVDSLSTASQLIPFTIGLASSLRAIQQTVVILIKAKYPDWNQIDFNIALRAFGSTEFQITKQRIEHKPAYLMQDPLSQTWI